MRKGKFIVFEGLDGSGKTTQVRNLKSYFEEKQRKVFFTREPTDGPIGTMIRRLASGQFNLSSLGGQLLFCADREYHLTNEIEPALNEGVDVVCDRYMLSTIVYGGRENRDLLLQINSRYRFPDLTLIFDIPVKRVLDRIVATRKETEIYESENSLKGASEGYLYFAKTYPNVCVIDATKSIEEVHEEIKRTLEERLYRNSDS